MRASSFAALLLAACGDTAGPPGLSAGPITSEPGTASRSSTGGDTSSTSTTGDSIGSSIGTSTGTIRDVGVEADFGTGQPAGCQGKVDLLFVISRSGTMATEQAQLLASFAGFIDTVEQRLEGFDVHIMTANPDGSWPGDACEHAWWGCKANFPDCGETAEDYQCGVYPDLVDGCDDVLGAGLTFNVGGYAANKVCELQGGHRYIVSGQTDMPGAFECIAKVGASGGDSLMGDAMVAALSSELNRDGGCNEGFLREDALLVIVLITDSNEDNSQSYAKTQYEAIVAAKGDPSAVVMLAVVHNAPGEFEPAKDCEYWKDSYGTFEDLLSRFPYAVFGDTCTPSYAPFLEEAADKISEACASYIPQ